MNYFKDHTKLIVGGERQFIVTYINSERQSRSWSLPDLARRGALPQVGLLYQNIEDFEDTLSRVRLKSVANNLM